MKFGTLILYKLIGLKQPKRNRFCRIFHGWKDKSQYSKYTYTRNGFITKIPHIDPSRSLIIVRREDSKKIMQLFRKHKVSFFTRDIVLNKSDIKKLRMKK